MGMTVGAYIREFEMEDKSDMLAATSVAEPEVEFETRAANETQLPGASNEYR